MKILYRLPLDAVWLGALGGLVLTLILVLALPNQALAQNSPTITWEGSGSDAAEFDENALGTIGDYSASASDDSEVTYELTGADADDFYISNLDGDAGTVYNNRGFDFENSADKQLTFNVKATAGGAILSRAVTITIGDTNDRPAFVAGVFECGFREDDWFGAACLGDVKAGATDDDADSLTYSLSDASPLAEYLDIDPAEGTITLSEAGWGRLDFEARPEFKVSVRVSDGKDLDGNADAEIDDMAVIRVLIADATHEQPVLTSQLVNDKHTTIRAKWTTDMATAQQYMMQHRAVGETEWLNHDLTAEGALQQGSGFVYTAIEGLYADTEYEMRYCWDSPGELASCSSGTWRDGGTLRTRARPNEPAAITGIPKPLSIAENADPVGKDQEGNSRNAVGTVYVSAGAGDDGDQNEMRFWLEGDDAANFTVSSLDARTIIVRTTKALDHEAKASYTLTLHVSDGRSANGAKDLSSDDSAEITITVTDVVEPAGSPLLASTGQGPNSVQLSWATPDAGDQTIAGYHVQYRQAGETAWGHTSHIVGNAVTIEHLQPNTAYEFRGVTTTTGGPPTWSDRDLAAILTVTTEPGTAGQRSEPRSGQSSSEPDPSDKPSPAPASPPAAPQNLAASAGTAGSVTLAWDASDDASITGYQILRKLRGTRDLEVLVENTGSAAVAFTDTEVEPDTRYVYRVKAINAAGVSSWSNYVRVTSG